MRLTLVVLLVTLLLAVAVEGQQTHRNPFEARTTSWHQGAADVPFKELAHETSTLTARAGKQSEYVKLTAEQGTHIYYVYPVGKADLLDELTISIWIKANRPGVQFLARLVLPRERDLQNLDQPLTTLIRGDTYQLPGRWQPLRINGVAKLVQQQQQLMRYELKRDVNFEGAYIDQLLLNVYGGRGLTEVWIDDLEIGPILGDVFQPAQRPGTPGSFSGSPVPGSPVQLQAPRSAIIELNQDRLLINRRPFFVRGIRLSDTPLEVLHDAGFNTLWVDHSVPEEILSEAVRLGFWLVPDLPVLEDNPRMATPTGLTREVSRFPYNDAILFWHVGTGLTAEQSAPVTKAARTIRSGDPYQGRPVAGDIWDGFKPYSRELDMVGIHRWPLLTGLELPQYREWLCQRVRLAVPGTYLWTWIQTHLPDWYTTLVYEQPSSQPFQEPIGPQPEQIRLLTYIAVSAGYKGLGFWSDRFLASSHQGRDRLLALALLNQELEMLEPILATAKDVYWIPSKHPEIKAAALRFERGLLVLPIWMGPGAQCVPGQSALANLEIVIPGAPQDAQVLEVSPGEVRALRNERVAGGVKITVPDFGLTTAVVFTADVNLIGRLQQDARRTQKLAAQWSYDLAAEELKKVELIHAQLEQLGHTQPDARKLLEKSRSLLNAARDAWTRGTQPDYRVAYAEAQRALQPLRILMRAHWEAAVNVPGMDSPVSSPYTVSFYTLPRHWQFAEEIRSSRTGANLLAHGDFELAPHQAPEGWKLQEEALDNVAVSAQRVLEQPHQGRQCLKLEVKPKDLKDQPAALERTFLAITTPAVQLPPGSLVRVSGWIRIPQPIQASADGVLFFDSIGGEPLALRLTGAVPAWKKFSLYRRVPPSGVVNVTMALTGVGVAYFDDVRVEQLYNSTQPPILQTGGP
jgi:hypothetical protein